MNGLDEGVSVIVIEFWRWRLDDVECSHVVCMCDGAKTVSRLSRDTTKLYDFSPASLGRPDDDWYNTGGRTPMHDGSRTPMHDGSRTPLHDAFAPNTPMHDGVWDPSQTPAHRPSTPSTHDGFADGGFESAWGAMDDSGLSALTPGSVGTPGFNPGELTASTSHMKAPIYLRSELREPSLPPPAVVRTRCPGTPGGPNTPGQPATPGGPATPGTPGGHWAHIDHPYEPGTPSAFESEHYPTGIQVEVIPQDHRRAKIVELVDDSYLVQFLDQPTNVTVPHHDLALVRPVKKDRVVIVKGPERNSLGTLMCEP
ncbi:MAG: hypothetical protein SGPRY_011689 [Prymnesium sp.]